MRRSTYWRRASTRGRCDRRASLNPSDRARAQARVAPRLHDDVGPLVDGASHRTVACDGRDHESDQFADLRHPTGKWLPESGVRSNRARALARLARRGAAIDPFTGAAVPGAVDAGEVPLVGVNAEVRVRSAKRPRRVGPA